MNIDDIKIGKSYELADGRVLHVVQECTKPENKHRRVEYDEFTGGKLCDTGDMSLIELAASAIREI